MSEISFLTYIHRFGRFPHIIFEQRFDTHLALRVHASALLPDRDPALRMEVRVRPLSNLWNPRNLRMH
ncbi:MAG TPA: hypothetical protein VFQ78_03435 [Candidatus Udaeobacter sp.]|jgi:hypothetical protein|nr:hypothetical protein [Candidatus Udaeobacter sp.]